MVTSLRNSKFLLYDKEFKTKKKIKKLVTVIVLRTSSHTKLDISR